MSLMMSSEWLEGGRGEGGLLDAYDGQPTSLDDGWSRAADSPLPKIGPSMLWSTVLFVWTKMNGDGYMVIMSCQSGSCWQPCESHCHPALVL